ncbi:GMC oxidoreductase [Amanita thiersii Skay4041]|uniref:GMC oxidoreductase n=1 Tax=Amanita thiersii Skay4041 TaxID=703135 RepID=A0A2A9NJW0_9AGAR|nr:GMC oxidoreductase [Amanita thiersii Skay4041]
MAPTWRLDHTLSEDQVSKLSSPFEAATKATAFTTASVVQHEEALPSTGISKDTTDNFSFDYIVVGGGTAGLALASRLADSNPNINICVFESGIFRSDSLVNVPGLYGMSNGNPAYDWSYKTVPQPELNNRQVSSSAGRLLGGSSGINFLVRMRAGKPEYDAWSEFGNGGWDWDGLLPFFKKQEKFVGPVWGTGQVFPGVSKEEYEAAKAKESQFQGFTGPVHKTHNELYTDVLKPTIESLNNLGIRTNISPDYGNSTGIFNIGTAVNRATGQRSYAANAYLPNPEDITPKPNLRVLTGCHVTKVLLKPGLGGEPATATGVEFIWIDPDTGRPKGPQVPSQILASKEVIVATGTYNTPRLLELSGIGNPDILKQFNIPTIVDLPGVGENLQEHTFIATDYTVKDGVFTFDRLRTDPAYQQAQITEYLAQGTGAYATTVSAYGFIKLDRFLTATEIKELRAQLDTEIAAVTNPFHKQQLLIQKRHLDDPNVGDVEVIMVPKVFATNPPGDKTSYVSFVTCLPHPVPRGSVHITSTDPLASPAINPNYLASKFDTMVSTKTTAFLRKITETAPLKDVVVAPSTPPPTVVTGPQFEAYIRGSLGSMEHPIGTASMAPRAQGGVVDPQLRVYGTSNLRVVDMSIVPLHVAAHTLDTAYAIGEKAFNIITQAN